MVVPVGGYTAQELSLFQNEIASCGARYCGSICADGEGAEVRCCSVRCLSAQGGSVAFGIR